MSKLTSAMRSHISKLAWRKRKPKGTDPYTGKPIYAGGVRKRGVLRSKVSLAAEKMGIPPALVNPLRLPGNLAEALTAKEPWQMTREAYFAERYAASRKLYPELPARLPRKAGRYVESFYEGYGIDHGTSVRKALSEGKPVPPEVLADYPDLVAQDAKVVSTRRGSTAKWEAEGIASDLTDKTGRLHMSRRRKEGMRLVYDIEDTGAIMPPRPPAKAVNPLITPGDTMGEAISLTSPSGKMSKAALKRAQERIRVELFGEKGLPVPQVQQPSELEVLRRQASELRALAERGMKPKAYLWKAQELEQRVAELEAKAANPTVRPTLTNPLRPRLTPFTGRKLPRVNPYQMSYGPTGFRPPSTWFAKMMARLKMDYKPLPGMSNAEYNRAIARIVGGVWARFDDASRRRLLRRYEGI